MTGTTPYLRDDHQLSAQLRAMLRSRKNLSPEKQALLDAEMDRIKEQVKQAAQRRMVESGQPIITEPPCEG